MDINIVVLFCVGISIASGMFSFLLYEKSNKLFVLFFVPIILVVSFVIVLFLQFKAYQTYISPKIVDLDSEEGKIQIVVWYEDQPMLKKTEGFFEKNDIVIIKSQNKFWFIHGTPTYEVKFSNQ